MDEALLLGALPLESTHAGLVSSSRQIDHQHSQAADDDHCGNDVWADLHGSISSQMGAQKEGPSWGPLDTTVVMVGEA